MKVELYENYKLIDTFNSLQELSRHIRESYSSVGLALRGKDECRYGQYTIKKALPKETRKDWKIEFRKLLNLKPLNDWQWKEQESKAEKRSKMEWEQHCSECCERSVDDKVWLPKSLIKEFPKLSEHTLPWSMSF